VSTVDDEVGEMSTSAIYEVERGTRALRRLDEPPAE